MVDRDPAQSGVSVDVVAELAGAGFVDAVEIGRGGVGGGFRCVEMGVGRGGGGKGPNALSGPGRGRVGSGEEGMAAVSGRPPH
ncbi:hypothetical protein, partial [Mycobacterium simulans]|uniref:hypothetical protein n=1 Tax=Mycobacterium simulans TaxID=627089 RepID=UPI001CD77E00